MKKMLFVSLLFALNMSAYSQQVTADSEADPPCPDLSSKKTLSDWSDLSRYQSDNATLGPPAREESRVVFFGSSTTDNWGRKFDSVFFPGKPYINRGISGETSSQMLLRFQQDVLDLKPAVVVFLGGTNDVAGNSGAMSLEMTENNIRAMAAMAEVSGVKMILASQLPVITFPWNKCVHPESNLLALTAWEKKFATAKHLGFVDYYSVLVGANGTFQPGLSVDGVHPNKKAYEMMAPVVEAVIHEATNSH